MLPRTVVVIFLLLMSVAFSYAFQARAHGVVKGDDGQPVEFCIVSAANSNYVAYSNELGEFSLDFNTDSSGSIIFYCLGYEKKVIPIGSEQHDINVILKRKINELSNAVIAAHVDRKGKKHEGIMGKSNLKPYGICTGFTGSESAIFLQGDTALRGELEKIFFYITKEGIPDARFRVHVYDIDTNYLPGKDMLDSNIVLHATEGNEWISVDVSSIHIPTQGMFISMEWIEGYGNTISTVKSEKFSAQGDFNGQVLGFTNGYHASGSLYYNRKSSKKLWRYVELAGTQKRNVLNPMIYATYTYYKR